MEIKSSIGSSDVDDLAKALGQYIMDHDIIDGKVWIQRDGTAHGIAEELVEAGIPRERMVLGFRAPDLRQYAAYAVA